MEDCNNEEVDWLMFPNGNPQGLIAIITASTAITVAGNNGAAQTRLGTNYALTNDAGTGYTR